MGKSAKSNANRVMAAQPDNGTEHNINLGRSPSRWNKFNRTFFIGVGLVVFVFLLAWVGAWLMPHDPIEQNLRNGLQDPSWDNLLGTDQFGRDILTRILYGMRIDLQIGIIATAYTMLIGVAVGAITGFFGGWVDSIFMRFLDMLIAFPRLVLTIAVIAMLGQGIINIYIAIGIVGWIAYARLLRGDVLVAKETEYALAARTIGAKNSRIIWRHLMPNVITPCIVFAMSDVILNILYVAALGFLGLGIQPPSPEIGTMIADGRKLILTYPNLTTFPGMAIVIIGVAFSVLGDGLADYLRPPQ
ncbi:MAG: ABC transporter permease [Anaerolineaceae bacterium]|nr:ABC transporter permease [Anaerolineaceae bacterium]